VEKMNISNTLKSFAVPSEPSSPIEPSASQPARRRWFGKKTYAIIAVVAVIVIAAAFFIPPSTVATIPLNVDYVVGEKMVYDTSFTMGIDGLGSSLFGSGSSSLGLNSSTIDGQQTLEVIGFDGENYLINHTTTMTVLGKPVSISLTEKMNKTGYSTYLFNIGDSQTELPSSSPTGNSYLAQLMSKPEAKVGETISIPYPNDNSLVQTTGDLKITFNGVEDLTVPAGTYRAFRIDMRCDDLKMTYNLPQNDESSLFSLNNLSMTMNLDSKIYLEYGTMRQIKSTLDMTMSYDSSILNMTASMSMDMTLQQHIKP
jgi:hypothetical protein